MKDKEKATHIVDVIFVLALFGLFALSSLFIITAGAEIYKNTVNNMQENYKLRTSSSYLSEKVRQGERVELTEVAGQNVILITETTDDSDYYTYLYFMDGKLKELYISPNATFSDSMLKAGQTIMELDDLQFEKAPNGIIKANIRYNDGSNTTILLNSYSGD